MPKMPLPLEDPKELEGRDGKKNEFREFFWDSVVLYVVYSIIALAAIDALTEYIRGSNVACRVKEDTEYINNYCSGNLPPTQFFPVFIVVHAILIAIPHYLWLNLYGDNFDFFFDLALQLKPIKTKGKYEETNFTIVSELDSAFNTFRQNWMFPVYFLKLVLQLGIALCGFIGVIVVFTDFNETFDCPRNFSASDRDPFWPMNTTVQCVFTTLRLLSLIRIADLVLLALVILGFIWAIVWSIRPHSAELGSKDIARFSFQTGLLPRFYVRDFCSPRAGKHNFCFPRAGKFKNFMQTVYSFMPWTALHGPRISSDLDFMLLKLFRTNGGLGYTFRMTQVLLELKYLEKNGLRCLSLYLLYSMDDEISSEGKYISLNS